MIGEMPSIPESYDPLVAQHVREARAAYDTENYDRAIASCERLLARRPDTAEAYLLLGLTSWKLDEPSHAVDLLRRAQNADPNTREYADALATLLGHLGDSNESLYFAKLATVLSPHPLGDDLLPAKLREYFKHLAFARPHIYRTRARDAFNRGALGEATGLLDKQVELTPMDPETLRLAFEVHLETGALARAVTAAEAAIELGALAGDHDRMARAMATAGFFEAAHEAHETALAQRPDDPDLAQSRLRTLALQHGDGSGFEEYEHACATWSKQFAPLGETAPYDNPPKPDRPLRIGYAGADLHASGLAPMLESVLNAHDRDAFDVYIYARGSRQDMTTQNLMRASTRWTEMSGVDPVTAAQIMRNDGIDILVDLVGHGRDSHLRTFAQRPAPVRLGWLGVVPATRSLYDAHLMGDGNFTLPVDHPITPGSPVTGAAPDRPVTFGIVAPVSAISADVMNLAGRMLNAVPSSRLLVANTGHHDEETMARIHALADEHGLSDRVSVAELEDRRAPRRAFFEHIDIALDTAPDSRFVETAEAIAAGVPVLASPHGRAARVLSATGHDDWTADAPDALVEIAKALVSDRNKLTELRAELPRHALASPLFDPARFTALLEEAYRAHWRAWCARA